jgi:hypothetical protein
LEPRPYRDESAGAIAHGRAITRATRALQAIFDLRDTRTAAGSGAALTADLFDGLRTTRNGGVELTVADGMAEADDHGTAPNLKMPFNGSFVKGDQNTRPPRGSFPPHNHKESEGFRQGAQRAPQRVQVPEDQASHAWCSPSAGLKAQFDFGVQVAPSVLAHTPSTTSEQVR